MLDLVHPSETAAAVVLGQVVRSYRSGTTTVHALDGVSLTVAPGEAVAVTGPSGSGKTTLLNIVAGIERPSSGSVTVLGVRLDASSERELTAFRAKHVGIVFQEAFLLPGLSALDNVIISRLPWTRRRVLEPQAHRLLGMVRLAGRAHHTPARLSGGERQRVSIARALIGGPTLLLLDEPTGNLDSGTTDEVLDLLAQLRREMGFAVLVATHDAAVASVADRVVRLVAGRVVEERRSQTSGVEVHEVR